MIRRSPLVIIAVILAASCHNREATAEPAYVNSWIKLFGTTMTDECHSVAADKLGNVYVSGLTNGSLPGYTNSGSYDAFVRKYDAAGNVAWTRQFGTTAIDESYGVSADGLGNVYVTGRTFGSLLGNSSSGHYDVFVNKYDAAGNLAWAKQFGTTMADIGHSISTDGLGNVFIGGMTTGAFPGSVNAGDFDALVSKYDTAGNLVWSKQLGSTNRDEVRSVSADGLGNVYVTGSTWGLFAGNVSSGDVDGFVSKYDAAGNLAWTKQFGTAMVEESLGIAADNLGNVYVSGRTHGSLPGNTNLGYDDAFLSKYDAAGNLVWTKQFGTWSADEGYSVSLDGLGNVYVSGSTTESLPGNTSSGNRDAFISKFDAAGNLAWIKQFGTNRYDESYGISADGLGNVYVSGMTQGPFPGNLGAQDAFVAQFSVPEPHSLTLLLAAAIAVVAMRLAKCH